MSGYENLVWIRDNERREFVCEVGALRENFRDGDALSDEELLHCSNVNEIVGTERW